MATGTTKVQSGTTVEQSYLLQAEDTLEKFGPVLNQGMEEFIERLVDVLPIGIDATITVKAEVKGIEIPVEFQFTYPGEGEE